jgi:RimJ/RimL family protein N-acetyltransferase
MRHDLRLEGHAFALRPVTLEDAEFIVQVRTSDPRRVRYLHPISPDVQAQRDWIATYLERENDYYWVIERQDTQAAEGLIGIYNLAPVERTGEWGRWVLKPGSLAAIESAWLVYRAGFESLQLDSVYCLTLANNRPVVSFHDSCGLQPVALLKNHFQFDGQQHDAVKHLCSRATWPAVSRRLEPQAQAIAKRFHSMK